MCRSQESPTACSHGLQSCHWMAQTSWHCPTVPWAGAPGAALAVLLVLPQLPLVLPLVLLPPQQQLPVCQTGFGDSRPFVSTSHCWGTLQRVQPGGAVSRISLNSAEAGVAMASRWGTAYMGQDTTAGYLSGGCIPPHVCYSPPPSIPTPASAVFNQHAGYCPSQAPLTARVPQQCKVDSNSLEYP